MSGIKRREGASGDAMLLMVIKLVTILLGFTITRLLSEHLSVYDYGTYSQILLVVSVVASMTILGMMDGVNYFYCRERDAQKREAYISTIFSLQCIVSTAAGAVVMLLSGPLCTHFDNPDVGKLLIFGASLPLFQNLLFMIQVLLVSVGKARMLALRNLIVSLLRLAVVLVVVTLARNVAVILATTLVLDVAQVALFAGILKKNQCPIHFRSTDFRLVGQIFRYCAPMAVFTVVSSLSRDCDKYLVALMTDTETLAVYSNASKVLPFDIIMTSFCTVLLPEITRLVSDGEGKRAASLYKVLLEIAFVSTGILCCAALAAAPQLMELLYSRKYIQGLTVFCIYIMVDLLRFTNITLILSAAGKTKTLMFIAVGALGGNAALNPLLFRWLGLPGPALATLVTTLATGVVTLSLGARELGTKLRGLFDWPFLFRFACESLVLTLLLGRVRQWLEKLGFHYFPALVLISGIYAGIMLLLQGKRLVNNLKNVNNVTKKQ